MRWGMRRPCPNNDSLWWLAVGPGIKSAGAAVPRLPLRSPCRAGRGAGKGSRGGAAAEPGRRSGSTGPRACRGWARAAVFELCVSIFAGLPFFPFCVGMLSGWGNGTAGGWLENNLLRCCQGTALP